MRNNNILQTALKAKIVSTEDPSIEQWVAKHSRARNVIVEREVNGKVKKFQERWSGNIVAGTGLRPQHLPERRVATKLEPLPSNWYDDEKNEYNRGFDPMGAYTKSAYALIVNFYVERLKEVKATAFVGGGAAFADQFMMAAAQKMGLPTLVAIPLPTQMRSWPKHVQDIYIRQAEKADIVVLVSTEEEVQGVTGEPDKNLVSYAMNKRNRFMLRLAHSVLATWRGANGGTKNAIRDALEMNLPVTEVYQDLMKLVGYEHQNIQSFGNVIESESWNKQNLYDVACMIGHTETHQTALIPALQVEIWKVIAREVIHQINTEDTTSEYRKFLRELHTKRNPLIPTPTTTAEAAD